MLIREDGHIFKRVLNLYVDGQRKKGRPKRIWQRQVEEQYVKIG